MEPKNNSEEDLNKEFKNLGKNIVNTFQSFLQSPQMKIFQEEIESGLNELGTSIIDGAEQVISSPAAQQIKTSVGNAKENLNSDELETNLRKEIASTLQKINRELEKFSKEFASKSQPDSYENNQGESEEKTSPENKE